MNTLNRLINLLKLDKKDIVQIFFYAVFSGVVVLSLPLGVQAIIGFIQAGRISISWIVLIIFVLLGVAASGLLSLLQLRITENIQQKIFIRSSFDFAFRLPRLKFKEVYGKYAPELANRFFDTLTLQKGVSKLLLDVSAASLQISFGLALLSFYHHFFLFFGAFLAIFLFFIFKYSYAPSLESSLNESKYKYKVAAWLQELGRNLSAFKRRNQFHFALRKNDGLVKDYISYREKHFKIIKSYSLQFIALKLLLSAFLLIVGGLLVLNQQMNIGQFVASEIVIVSIINSSEKIIIGLETFYDILTSVEKIGQITDMEVEPIDSLPEGSINYDHIILTAEHVSLRFPDSDRNTLNDISLTIEQGEKILITGENSSGRGTLLALLSGMLQPTSGALHINDDTFRKINLDTYRSNIACILYGDTLFEGSIFENITFGHQPPKEDLQWALDALKLTEFIKTLPDGLNTKILDASKQLSSSNIEKILLARAIISKPAILFLEDPTDKMDEETAFNVIRFLSDPKHTWTLVVVSKRKYWHSHCNREISLHKGRISKDTKIALSHA